MNRKKEIITGVVCCIIVLVLVLGSEIKKNPVLKNEASANSSQHTESTVENNKTQVNDKQNSSTENNQSSSNNSSDSSSSDSKYKDGTFTGSAQGYNGNIKVSVVVSGGKITSIDVLESTDDEEYFVKAKGLINEIISSQSTDVNVVSGATYSSNGIINAVANALN